MERKDIGLRVEGGRFTLRAAALIIDHGRLLAVRDSVYDSYYTVGGRIRTGESSAGAALREAFEETGRQFEIDRLLFIQERFFEHGGMEHHELAFYYLMKGDASDIADGSRTDQGGESMHWLPLETLGQVSLVPEFLADALQKLPTHVMHVVSREK